MLHNCTRKTNYCYNPLKGRIHTRFSELYRPCCVGSTRFAPPAPTGETCHRHLSPAGRLSQPASRTPGNARVTSPFRVSVKRAAHDDARCVKVRTSRRCALACTHFLSCFPQMREGGRRDYRAASQRGFPPRGENAWVPEPRRFLSLSPDRRHRRFPGTRPSRGPVRCPPWRSPARAQTS